MTINLNGIDANCIKEGSSGTPILILPGWGATSAVYNLIVKQLAESHIVYVLDLPGFGITKEPPIAWSVDDYSDFVVSFIENLHLNDITLIGHSYGGRIVINLCNRSNSFLIKKIVLIDSAGIRNPLTKEQQNRQNRFKKLKKLYSQKAVSLFFPNALEKLQEKYGSADYASASPIMKQALVKAVSTDYSDLIQNITHKTLLIWGENDTATPLSDAQKMNRLIADSKLEIILNAGHFPFLDQPFEFRKVLEKHFNS